MQAEFPFATCRFEDITSEKFLHNPETYDVVVMNYVLQFVPVSLQMDVLRAVIRYVAPGGVLIYGHKAKHEESLLGRAAHDEYIEFRVRNGYTREEIEAKTKALKGSMATMDHGHLLATIHRSFRDVQETFRFMMFCAFMAVK